ncbi:hypothetical protein EDD27_6805 [Nonomuraea polychroma]|uniref:Uncharacterized protein n=1 Tax=Nonomuraea polychroma TaxID=46176 RepID=A0A438ME66_9ACTN|nr:hypothetical protein [Nonomuraea polychroma]RVX44083.1 hypothetical protein EDD27_6805 [Nonomuraea polychroma]
MVVAAVAEGRLPEAAVQSLTREYDVDTEQAAIAISAVIHMVVT